jgi:thiamine-phosphate pyrophosphorylase
VIPVPKRIGRLHVITDTTVQDRFDHVALARLAIAGGADTIQLRDKLLGDDELTEVARGALVVCRRAGVPLIVNDRVEVAVRAVADGVHLGRDDTPIAEARERLGPDAIIGGSAGAPEEIAQAAASGADYVGFGHIYPTTTKQKPGAPVGLETLRGACEAAEIPVIAIGGITAANAGDVMRAGAWGLAVVGAVCAADSPERAARQLARALGKAADSQSGR